MRVIDLDAVTTEEEARKAIAGVMGGKREEGEN